MSLSPTPDEARRIATAILDGWDALGSRDHLLVHPDVYAALQDVAYERAVCRWCARHMPPRDAIPRDCSAGPSEDGDICMPRPHRSHVFPNPRGRCDLCDVAHDDPHVTFPCQREPPPAPTPEAS